MKSNITPRENFYANEMNYDRMETVLEEIAQTLTLAEVLKMVREICYDMVYYNNAKDCGVIYRDKTYSRINQEQACRLQRLVSTACDLFGQCVIQHREFDEGYLEKWLNGESLQHRISQLEDEITELKERLAEND